MFILKTSKILSLKFQTVITFKKLGTLTIYLNYGIGQDLVYNVIHFYRNHSAVQNIQTLQLGKTGGAKAAQDY